MAIGVRSVAERLEVSTTSVYLKANNLRDRGVNLQDMPRVRDNDSVDSLNALIERKLIAR